MTAPAKPRRHFIAWSPQRELAWYAKSKRAAQMAVREYESDFDGSRPPPWRFCSEQFGWRVTEVSE